MTEIMRELYYMVEDAASQHYENSEEAKALLARRSELKEEITLRLGADGQHLMDTLSDLSLSLEDIHDEALFRAAMQLGTQIAQPKSLPPTGGKVPPKGADEGAPVRPSAFLFL